MLITDNLIIWFLMLKYTKRNNRSIEFDIVL